MTSELRFIVIGEDPGHLEVARRLVDRVLLREVDWISEEVIEHVRRWIQDEASPYVPLTSAFRRARDRGLPIYGHFDGSPGLEDAASARAALLLVRDLEPSLDLVVLARDLDRREERLAGLRQARGSGRWPFEVVIAAAEPEIEAWFVAGFMPLDDEDRERWEILRSELGFDPTREPHRLVSTTRGHPRDAKTVLSRLAPTSARQEACLETPIDSLRDARYEAVGLAAFLRDVALAVVAVARRPG